MNPATHWLQPFRYTQTAMAPDINSRSNTERQRSSSAEETKITCRLNPSPIVPSVKFSRKMLPFSPSRRNKYVYNIFHSSKKANRFESINLPFSLRYPLLRFVQRSRTAARPAGYPELRRKNWWVSRFTHARNNILIASSDDEKSVNVLRRTCLE